MGSRPEATRCSAAAGWSSGTNRPVGACCCCSSGTDPIVTGPLWGGTEAAAGDATRPAAMALSLLAPSLPPVRGVATPALLRLLPLAAAAATLFPPLAADGCATTDESLLEASDEDADADGVFAGAEAEGPSEALAEALRRRADADGVEGLAPPGWPSPEAAGSTGAEAAALLAGWLSLGGDVATREAAALLVGPAATLVMAVELLRVSYWVLSRLTRAVAKAALPRAAVVKSCPRQRLRIRILA